MITITLTLEEVVALRQLLHRAVLHSGMDAAQAACHFNQKLNEAVPVKANGKLMETHVGESQ